MTGKTVLMEIDGRGVATVTLNRPEVHNCFNADVVVGLQESFDELAGRDDLRAAVLQAEGKSFRLRIHYAPQAEKKDCQWSAQASLFRRCQPSSTACPWFPFKKTIRTFCE